jgi:hypothetical protein
MHVQRGIRDRHRTFDLNVLQGPPENPRHDVCEPDDLHNDLQRGKKKKQGVSFRNSEFRNHMITGIYRNTTAFATACTISGANVFYSPF